MCDYITAILPPGVDPDSVSSIFEEHKFGFELIVNPHLAKQVEPGAWQVMTTRGQCDCGTAIGSLTRPEGEKEPNFDRELTKFRAQGWSEAKIQRWLDQKSQVQERHKREDDHQAQGSTAELDQWINLINDLLNTGKARWLGLLLHTYHRGIESERITIVSREKVMLAELTAAQLMKLKQDVVYEFAV